MGARRNWLLTGAVVALVALAGWAVWNRGEAMTEKAPLPAMRTICVGRHLIDIPADMSVSGDVDLIYGLDKNFRTVNVRVLREKGTTPSLEALVAQKVGELTSRHNDKTPSKNMLAGWHKVDDDTVLIRAHETPTMRGYFTALVVVQRGEAVGLVTADIFEHDKPEDIEAKALAVARGISFVSDPEHAGKGTCLEPLLIDAKQDGEVFTQYIGGDEHKDVQLKVDVSSLLAVSDGGLLHRIEKNAGPLAKMGIYYRPIRKGRITLDGRQSEEFLDVDKDHDKVIRLYSAETLVVKPSTFAEPRIALHLDMGGQITGGDYVDASFNEAESLALWDAIIKSVRLRPGAL